MTYWKSSISTTWSGGYAAVEFRETAQNCHQDGQSSARPRQEAARRAAAGETRANRRAQPEIAAAVARTGTAASLRYLWPH